MSAIKLSTRLSTSKAMLDRRQACKLPQCRPITIVQSRTLIGIHSKSSSQERSPCAATTTLINIFRNRSRNSTLNLKKNWRHLGATKTQWGILSDRGQEVSRFPPPCLLGFQSHHLPSPNRIIIPESMLRSSNSFIRVSEMLIVRKYTIWNRAWTGPRRSSLRNWKTFPSSWRGPSIRPSIWRGSSLKISNTPRASEKRKL